MEGDRIPIRNHIPDAASISVGSFHGLGPPILNLLTVMTFVEEMFHGFLSLVTKGTPGRAYKASFYKIIPSEDAILSCEPKENWRLWAIGCFSRFYSRLFLGFDFGSFPAGNRLH